MPTSPPTPCTKCGQRVIRGGLCARHYAQADKARGTSTERGYNSREHRDQFRTPVLARDPVCVICRQAPATEADHYPLTRKELIRQGLDPNDPRHGRGLCHRCHSRHTASTTPGFGKPAN